MNDKNTPRAAAVGWLLFFTIIALSVIGWLAWQRLPSIVYLFSDHPVNGWAALLAGWPVWGLAGLASAIIGGLAGGWVGDNAQTRDARANMERAERLAVEYREIADQAQADASAALSKQMRRAENAEQRAATREAGAEQARRDAEQLIAPAQQRINKLAEQNALLQRRLDGALESLERRKRQVHELQGNVETLKEERFG